MELYNNILCISGSRLIRSEHNPDGIIPDTTYRNWINRKRIQVVRRGGGENNPALIAFDSLPEKYKKVIRAHEDVEVAAQQQELLKYITADADAAEFFRTYTIEYNDNTKGLSEEKQYEYVNNAEVLNGLVRSWEAHVSARGKQGKRPLTSKFWTNAVKSLPNILKDYGHTLKYTNWRRLQEKVKDYKAGGYASLISGKYANTNSVKITEEGGEWLVARWMSRIEILTTEQLFVEYNRKALTEGWERLKTPKTIYDYLHRPEIERIWHAARYGELSAKEKYSRQNRTLLPTRRDALWYSDGTKLNFFYRDADGKTKTCQVYEVIDVYSEKFLGYHISKTEDYEAQYYAFKMAIQVAGHKPYELKYDNQGGHKKLESGDFLKNISRHAIHTAPYNGKSKTIESVFKRFQEQFLHREWYFTGQNITAKKQESRANMEFILANPKKLPTLEEAIAAYVKRRNEWNEAPHFKTKVSKNEMYATSVNDKAQKVDFIDMVTMFGITSATPSTYRSSGIEIEVKRQKYAYEVLDATGIPDKDFNRRNIGRKFYVRYQPDDMSIVMLYEKDATGMRFISIAQPYLYVFRALQDQSSEDMMRIRQNQIANVNERIKDEKERNALLEKYGYHPNQHGLNVAPLKGISKKKKKAPIDIGQVQKAISNMDGMPADEEATKKLTKKQLRQQEQESRDEQAEYNRRRMELLQQQII